MMDLDICSKFSIFNYTIIIKIFNSPSTKLIIILLEFKPRKGLRHWCHILHLRMLLN